MALAGIAIGSNLGEKDSNARFALEELGKIPQTLVLKVSAWITSPALTKDSRPQPDYCNGVALVETPLQAIELLNHLLLIEKKMGRIRTHQRWEARVIDLDLLFYDDLHLVTPALTLPHPEMHQRHFVLEPLHSIFPEWKHPIFKKTAKELLNSISVGDRL